MHSNKTAPLLVLFMTACSSAPAPDSSLVRSDPDAGKAENDAGTGAPTSTLRFRPPTLYSGFDGEHTYKAPLAVYDAADDLELTIDDTAASITPVKLAATGSLDSGRYYMLSTKKAGDFVLTATSNGRTATAKVVVSPYTTARWTKGEQRYDGGDPPCTQCHSTEGIDHSPAALAGISDEAVGLVITEGISPNGFPISVNHPSNHKWTVSDDEKSSLITFLRTLEPRGFAP